MSELSPAAILVDTDGNQVGIILDGSVYRLQQIGKLQNSSGTTVNPATEDTLALIKSTDGIKKITDPVAVSDLAKWLGSTAPTVGQKAMTSSVPVVMASDQTPIPVSVSAVVAAMLATVVKTSAFTITTRVETQVVALNHTVATGKIFYLSYLGGAAFAPLSIILRLKVNGVVVFMATSWHTNNLVIPLPMPAPIATSGQQITVTYEAQTPNGSAWAGFIGIEV